MVYRKHSFRALESNLVRCRVTSNRTQAFTGSFEFLPNLLSNCQGHCANAVCKIESLILALDGDVLSMDDLFDVHGHRCIRSCERLRYASCVSSRAVGKLGVKLEIVEISKALDNVAGGNPTTVDLKGLTEPAQCMSMPSPHASDFPQYVPH